MFFEIVSTLAMAGVAGFAYYQKSLLDENDHKKIKKIADASGLYVGNEKIRIYRKTKNADHWEYVYQVPLGLSFNQFLEKKQVFTDGLNIKTRHDFNLKNLAAIDWRKNPIPQIKKLIINRTPLNKHIEMEFDGMIRFRVYDHGLPDEVPYNDELIEKVKDWSIPVGRSLSDFLVHDFEESPVLVVAGQTRYGKTVFLKNVITTLITNQPLNVEFSLIDLKGGLAFARFMNCRQVVTVAKNETETLAALESLHAAVLQRQREFLAEGFEDIAEAGYKKRHFVIVDEGAEIAGFYDKETRNRCQYLLGEIARIGAGLGFRVVFATQYPTADVFPRSIKSNTSAALCFRLKDTRQSMVVLDRAGAESLPLGQKGRAIYQTDHDITVQTPYITNSYIDEKIKIHIRSKKGGADVVPEHKQKATRRNFAVFEKV